MEPKDIGSAPDTTLHDRSHPARFGLDRHIRSRIGEKLQLMYGQIIYEGVPRHLVDSIRRIDSASEPLKRAERRQDRRAGKGTGD